MGDATSIQWTDATWNPIRGCSRVSEGCRHCYAETVAARFSGEGMPYEGLAKHVDGEPRWTGKVDLVEKHLEDPLRWRRQRRIFVNSMSDLFHEKVSNEWIDRIFVVMSLSPHHTFQILTKRPERMRAYFAGGARERIAACPVGWVPRTQWKTRLEFIQDWPLPNVWLGVSVEDQKTADERIPILLETPAAVRFISAEPLLGPVSFNSGMRCRGCGYTAADKRLHMDHRLCRAPSSLLDWVIVGGESGTGARRCDVGWIRWIIKQCSDADVACFVKQVGAKPTTDHRTRPEGEDWTWTTFAGGKGGDMERWPLDLRVREFPRAVEADRG